MKVLFTVATYYPDVDGVQNVTEYQAEYLAANGYEVVVIASNNHGRYCREENHNGVHIIRVDAYNKNMMHYGDKKSFQQLVFREAKNADVMINVSPESFSTDWVLPISGKIHCRKFVMNHGMHDFKWNKFNTSSGKEIIKKILRDVRWGIFYKTNFHFFWNYDGVLFLHEKDVARRYFEKKKYLNSYVIYNCAADVFFDIDTVKKQKSIINVGTYNSRKNQLECLDVFYKLSDSDWQLILIGNPENDYYKQLITRNQELSKRYGHRNVKIYCNLDRATTIQYIKESSIYLLTSTWEAFPISLIEAMASGSTFVSTDVGVVKYLPYGKVGKSSEEICDILNDICINRKYISLGRDAYTFAKDNFRIESQMKKMERILFNKG